VIISLKIWNTYETSTDTDDVIITYVTDAEIPDPPPMTGNAEADTDALNDWANEHIHDFTGADRPTGNAWYDVKVTACSDPDLIRHSFQFGY
jgi:hypothetical protein